MDHLFTAAEAALIIRLLIAHGVVDFFLQSNKGVADKARRLWASPYLWRHIGLITVFSWVALGRWEWWWAAAVIGVTHLLLDVAKLWVSKRWADRITASGALGLFLADQLLHLVVMVVLWLELTGGWGRFGVAVTGYGLNYRVLLRVLGYIIVIGPVRFIIRYFVERWSPDIELTNDGLKDAGITIGVLERVLVLTLVFIGQWGGIGFLVTAKSLLRLIDKPWLRDESPFSSRKHTEYVLIGTFLSFGFAIITGLVINWVLRF